MKEKRVSIYLKCCPSEIPDKLRQHQCINFSSRRVRKREEGEREKHSAVAMVFLFYFGDYNSFQYINCKSQFFSV